MIRWLMSIIGVGAFIFSLLGRYALPPLPETPENITSQQAIALTQQKAYHYVSIDAGVDTDQKIYNTVLHRPLYTSRNTGKCYNLTEAVATLSEDLKSYLGCIVAARIPSDGDTVSLRTVSTKTGEKDKVLKERLLAPLAGTRNRVWVLSETFRKGNEGQGLWMHQTSYTGVLTLMKDVNDNVPYPGLELSWNEIRRFILKTYNITVDPTFNTSRLGSFGFNLSPIS